MKQKLRWIYVLCFAMLSFFALPSFAQTITVGTSLSYSNNYGPSRPYYPYGWSAIKYSKSEMGNTGNRINSISYQYTNPSSYTYTGGNQKIYLAEVSDSLFTNSYHITPASVNATLVFDGTVSYPNASTPVWNKINFTTPFNYTGTGHLIVLYENRRGGSYANSSSYPRFYCTSKSGNARISVNSSSSNIFSSAISGSIYSYRPNTQFEVTSLSSNDLALTSWFYPLPSYAVSANTFVAVTLKNLGSAPQSGFTLKYSIDNGSTWVSANHSGVLLNGVQTVFTFPTTADMSSMGLYKMIAVVTNSGDTLNYNDTIRQNITSCGAGLSGSYTIGGSNPDFVSISDAVSFMKTCGITGACTFNIASGTYNEQIRIPKISGTSPTKTITFQAASLGSVNIEYDNLLSNTNYVVSLDTAQHVILKNLVVKSLGSIYSTTLRMYGANDCKIENNIFKVSSNSTSQPNISMFKYYNSTVSGSNVIKGNVIEKGNQGLSIIGSNTSTLIKNLLIEDNQIEDYVQYGIYSIYTDSLQIIGNDLSSDAVTPRSLYLRSNSNHLSVQNNKIVHSNRGDGMHIYQCTSNSSETSVVRNNMVSINGTTTANGMVFYYSGYIDIDFNTVLNTGSGGTSVSNIYTYSGSNYKLRCNNLVNKAGGYTIYTSSSSSIIASDYNNLYSTGSYVAYWSGYRTFSTLKSYSGKNTNSINSDVSFYSNTNLHTTSPILNGAATPLAGITKDLDGQVRSTTAPDIGADEFDILSNDGGISEFVDLNNPCPSTPFPVKVKFANYGSASITAATIQWSINGVTQTAKNYSGSLSVNAFVNVTLGNYTFLQDSVYSVKAWVSSVNSTTDGNAYNDTILKNNITTSLGNQTYLIGSSSAADFSTMQSALSELQSNGVCGPIVFNIESGTYTGSVQFSEILGVSDVNTITFKSLSGNAQDVIFQNNSQNSSLTSSVFYMNSAKHIVIKNVTLESTTGSYNRLVVMQLLTSDIEFDGCRFLGRSFNNTSLNYGLVNLQQADDVTFKNSYFENGSYGIYSYGNSGNRSVNLNISNCELVNNYATGIYISYNDSININHNTISNSAIVYNSYRGIQLYSVGDNTLIHSNMINLKSTSGSVALYIDNSGYSSVSNNKFKVYNNMIEVEDYGSVLRGAYINNSYYIQFLYNTIRIKGNNVSSYGVYCQTGGYNTFKNNSIHVDGGYPLYIYYGTNHSSDYNNLKGNTYVGRANNYSASSVNDWKANTIYGDHSVSKTPNYVSGPGLHIFDPTLNGAATPIVGITTDIDGDTRATNPDIGADEFLVLSRDAAITEILTPSDTTSIGTRSVKVRLKNMGTNNLITATIKWSVDGVTKPNYTWTGGLVNLQEDSTVVIGSHAFTAGSHDIKVWVSNPNTYPDMNNLNDTLVKTVFSKIIAEIAFSPNSISKTITSCNDSIIVPLYIRNIGGAAMSYSFDITTGHYDSTSTQTYASISAAETNHYFSGTPASADTLWLDITINGDFLYTNEYASVYVDNFLIGSHYGGSRYTNLTETFFLTGTNLQTALADREFIVRLKNSNYVGNGYGTQLHQVRAYADRDDWLTATSATTGTVTALDSTLVSLKLNSSYLVNGVYTEHINVVSNDPGNPSTSIPVTLTVNGTPDISLNSTTLSFSSLYVNATEKDSVIVYNNGCDDLIITNITSTNSMFVPQTTVDTIAPKTSSLLFFDYTPTSAGTHNGIATIFNNDASITLNLQGSATNPPTLLVTPTPVVATIANCGDSLIIPIKLENTGTSILTTSISSSSAGDSVNILMLTYGGNSGAISNFSTALLYNNTKAKVTQFNSGVAATVIAKINSMEPDMIVVPYTGTNHGTLYTQLSSTLNTFVNDGGYVIFTGIHSSSITNVTNSGLFTGSYVNYEDGVTLTNAAVNDSLTQGIPASFYSNTSDDFYYYNITNTDAVSLVKYGTYDMFTSRQIGSGKAIILGFHYYYSAGGTYTKLMASNVVREVGRSKVSWLDAPSSTQNITANNFVFENLKFKSDGLPAGQYVTKLKIVTNNPVTPITYLPCTLNVQNQLANAVDLGADTAVCGVISLDAGSYGSYAWNNGSTSQVLTVNQTGTYSVTVSNGTLCQSIDTVIVTVNPIPYVGMSGLPSSICSNDNPINLTGVPASGVFVGAGMTGLTFDPSSAAVGINNITYAYTNSHGCMATVNANVNVKAAPIADISGLNANYCPGDNVASLTLAPSGGVLTGSGVQSSSFSPQLAGPGNQELIYNVTVNGCSDADTANTNVYLGVYTTLTGLSSNYCVDALADTLVGSPVGGTFSGMGLNGNVFTAMAAGLGSKTILYTYTDTDGCENADSIVTVVHDLPSVSLASPTSILCANGLPENLIGTPTGGILAGTGIVNGMFDPASIGAGTHMVSYTYTDNNACQNSDTTYVNVVNPVSITFSNLSPDYCLNDTAVILSASPVGGTFAVAGSALTAFDPSQHGVGNHYITYSVNDINNCFAIDSQMVNVIPLPVVSFSGLNSNYCSNAFPATLVGSPLGGMFTGNGIDLSTFEPTTAGLGIHDLVYTYTDSYGCTNTDTQSVAVNAAPNVDAGADTTVTLGDAASLHAKVTGGSGSYSYQWSPSNLFANPNAAAPVTNAMSNTTNFTLSVNDLTYNCLETDQITVSVSGGPLGANLIAAPGTICEGDSAHINLLPSGGTGNYQFTWSSQPAGFTSSLSNPVVSPTVTTTYTCVTNDGPNSVTNDITINVNNIPQISVSNLDSIYCSNQMVSSLVLSPQGGTLTGSGILGSDFDPSIASIGTFDVVYEITTAQNCVANKVIQVTVNKAPTAYAGMDTILPCANGGVLLGQQPYSGVSYAWSPSINLNDSAIANPMAMPNMSTNYMLTAMDTANLCTAMDDVMITISDAPVANAWGDTTICKGGQADLHVSGGQLYLWNNGSTDSVLTVSPTSTRTYVVISTLNGCADSDTVTIRVNDPQVDLGKDTIICSDESIVLDAGVWSNYLWNTTETSQSIVVDSLNYGLGIHGFWVQVEDTLGCIGSDTVNVEIQICIGIEDIHSQIEMDVYPNPSKGIVTIEVQEMPLGYVQMDIMDVEGRMIQQMNIHVQQSHFKHNVDMSHLAKGVYVIHMKGDDMNHRVRVVIQ